MPAVVRVKRRIDEEPLSAFVLNGKRRRLDDDDTASSVNSKEELSTLLKFAGTIKEQDDIATTQYARLTKEEAKELVLQKSQKPKNIAEKSRQDLRQHQQEQRFRVVNCLRATLEEDSNASENSEKITIVDIEKHSANDKTADSKNPLTLTSSDEITNICEASTSTAAAATSDAAALAMPTDSDTGYVYDLYIPDNEQQANYVDLMDDNYLSIHAYDYTTYEDYYDNDENDEYDSEDSNQENYFRNEYPDEDDDADDDDAEDEVTRSLRKGLEKFMFEDDDEEDEFGDYDDSSSDDNGVVNKYRDPYIHSIEPEEEEGFCNDVDSCDIDRCGLGYARYMARILKKSRGETSDSDHDNESDSEEEFYKSGTDEDDDEYCQSDNETSD